MSICKSPCVTSLIVSLCVMANTASRADESETSDAAMFALIAQLRDGDENESREAISALKKQPEGTWSTSAKKELMSVFVNKKLPSEVRTRAGELFIERVYIHDESFDPFRNEMLEIATNRFEPAKVRQLAMMCLSIIATNRFKSKKVHFIDLGKVSMSTFFKADPEIASVCLEILKDRSEPQELRALTVNVLAFTIRKQDEAFEAIMSVMLDVEEDPDLRYMVIQTVGTTMILIFFPDRSTRILESLIEIARDDRNPVHLRVFALERFQIHTLFPRSHIEAPSRRYAQSLIDLFADEKVHRRVRTAAGSALLPSLDAELLPQLVTLLESDDRFVHDGAACAIGTFGGEADSAIPLLVKVWRDETEPTETRESAGHAISRIAPDEAAKLGITDKYAKEDETIEAKKEVEKP